MKEKEVIAKALVDDPTALQSLRQDGRTTVISNVSLTVTWEK